MIDIDQLCERIRERILEPDDQYHAGHCLNCLAQLTEADVAAGECSQCGSMIDGDDEELFNLSEDDDERDYVNDDFDLN